MIENAPPTAVRTIWAPLILHDLLMRGRGAAVAALMYGGRCQEEESQQPRCPRLNAVALQPHALWWRLLLLKHQGH